MQQQQIVIDITPEKYISPEIIEEANDLKREVYFGRLVSKSVLTDSEIKEYEDFIKEFVTEDDEPVDNPTSAKQQRLLIQTLYSSWQPTTENGEPRLFYAEANIGLFARLNPKIDPVVPDALVSLDVSLPEFPHEKKPSSYMIWEYGKAPEIVVEIVSNLIGNELGGKMKKYGRIGIKYYVVFDPDLHLTDDYLQVFELIEDGYRLREDFNLPGTNLNLTLWQGKFEGRNDQWLRWLDDDGNLLPTADEKAAIETERADKLEAKLRELGVEPNEI